DIFLVIHRLGSFRGFGERPGNDLLFQLGTHDRRLHLDQRRLDLQFRGFDLRLGWSHKLGLMNGDHPLRWWEYLLDWRRWLQLQRRRRLIDNREVGMARFDFRTRQQGTQAPNHEKEGDVQKHTDEVPIFTWRSELVAEARNCHC